MAKKSCSSPERHFTSYEVISPPSSSSLEVCHQGLQLGRTPHLLFKYFISLTCTRRCGWPHATEHKCVTITYAMIADKGAAIHAFPECTSEVKTRGVGTEGGVYKDKHVLTYMPCKGVLGPVVFHYLKRQDVGFFCMSSTAEGWMPY